MSTPELLAIGFLAHDRGQDRQAPRPRAVRSWLTEWRKDAAFVAGVNIVSVDCFQVGDIVDAVIGMNDIKPK